METKKTEEKPAPADEFANPPRCDCDAMGGAPHRHMRGGPEKLSDKELDGSTAANQEATTDLGKRPAVGGGAKTEPGGAGGPIFKGASSSKATGMVETGEETGLGAGTEARTGAGGGAQGAAATSEGDEVSNALLSKPAPEVIAAVEGIDDKKVLQDLLTTESAGKRRTTVITAIENKIAQ